MATEIKAICPECREEVAMGPDAYHVTLMDYGDGHYYSFICQHCASRVKKPADENIIDLLVKQGGVGFTRIHVIQEVREIMDLASAPLLQPGEVMDFIIDLHRMTGCESIPL